MAALGGRPDPHCGSRREAPLSMANRPAVARALGGLPRACLALAAVAAAARCAPLRHAPRGDPPPLATLVRGAVARYQPGVRAGAVGTRTVGVWLVGDGHGRIVASAAAPLRVEGADPEADFRRLLPRVDFRPFEGEVDALYPYAGTLWFLRGEMGPDSVYVFWKDRPSPAAGPAPAARGRFPLGLAAAHGLTPPAVRQAVGRAAPAETVWYLEDEHGAVLEVGTRPGGRDIEATRAMLAPRYPDRRLTCAGGYALPGRGGRPVPIVDVVARPAPK